MSFLFQKFSYSAVFKIVPKSILSISLMSQEFNTLYLMSVTSNVLAIFL